MRISDWSSDVCSSDLARGPLPLALRDDRIEPCQRGHRRLGETARPAQMAGRPLWTRLHQQRVAIAVGVDRYKRQAMPGRLALGPQPPAAVDQGRDVRARAAEQASEMQSLMRTSYA